MNIIHLYPLSNRPNGIKTVLEELTKWQKKAGNNVTIYSIRSGNDYECVNTPTKFIKKLESESPDIVVFHSLYFLKYIIFALILRYKNIPYLIELHGALSKQNIKKNYIKKKLSNILCFNIFLKCAKSIIYLNKNEYENSIVKYINPRHIIIPNGCNHIINLNRKAITKDSPINIVYLGRIAKIHKGLDLLLQAIKYLQDQNMQNKIIFKFYGNGHKHEIEWFVDQISELSSIAQFKGAIFGDSKDMALREADLFILTSRYEGMPMGILEALSYGLPCILTSETNMAEEVSAAKAGWITSLKPKDIANTIINAVEEFHLKYDILRNNALYLSKKYNWQSIAEDSIKKYQESSHS